MLKNVVEQRPVWLLLLFTLVSFMAGIAINFAGNPSFEFLELRNNPSSYEAVILESSSEKALLADAARWQGIAETYIEINAKALAADAARWGGRAEMFADANMKAQAASSARWSGLAASYVESTAPGFSQDQWADAARWTAIANFYGKTPDQVSPSLLELIAE